MSKEEIIEEKKKLNELEIHLMNKRRKYSYQRLMFSVSFISLVIGFFLILLPEAFMSFFYGFSDERAINTIKLTGGFLILISTVGFSNLYMSGFSPKRIQENESENNNISDEKVSEYLELVSLLKSIDKSIEKGKLESTLSEHERSEIIKNISTTIESQLNESLVQKIEEKYGTTIYNDKLSDKANELLTNTISRLKNEAEKLQSKATVNLSYGIASTIIAIFILIFVLMNAEPPKEATTITTVFYYTSRLFLVLLVQGISIFFLRLYKATLNDLMYINNEITNYEARRDALVLAFNLKETKSTIDMLSLLANTERNFILKKGESSIFNQSKETDDNTIDINLFKEILSKVRK